MRSVLLSASVAAALAFSAPAAHAQHAPAPAAAMQAQSAPRIAALPASLTPAPTADAQTATLEGPRTRSAWKYPMRGALIGALVGAAFSTYVMATADEYIGVPAYFYAVPGGALYGLALGGVANLIDPP